MSLYQEFIDRGLLAQSTDAEAIQKLLDNDRVTFYIGFDPTADSLHVGHFMQLKIMAHMQRAGHRPIALLGGGTGMIGDPSGKSDMRRMLTRETIAANIERFKVQMSKFIDISDGRALFVNNADWLYNLNYIDFLRDIGPCFSVNRMLAAECYKARLETGLTFLEFNYMIDLDLDLVGRKLEQRGFDRLGRAVDVTLDDDVKLLDALGNLREQVVEADLGVGLELVFPLLGAALLGELTRHAFVFDSVELITRGGDLRKSDDLHRIMKYMPPNVS